MIVDYHVHSDTSEDARGGPKEQCEAAMQKGISEICFTNHQEWESVIDRSYVSSMDDKGWKRIFSDVGSLRKMFPGLTIKMGCEIGYYPENLEDIKGFLGKFPFDYIIGSLHNVEGRFLDEHETTGEEERVAFFRKYYAMTLDMVREGYFDCLGHIDMIARYKEPVPFHAYSDLIESIASALKEKDIGFELNTKGWSQKGRQCHPSPDILRLLNMKGVRKVTVGSDSHSPGEVGRDIGKAMEVLRQAGFKEFCTFEKRKPIYHAL